MELLCGGSEKKNCPTQRPNPEGLSGTRRLNAMLEGRGFKPVGKDWAKK